MVACSVSTLAPSEGSVWQLEVDLDRVTDLGDERPLAAVAQRVSREIAQLIGAQPCVAQMPVRSGQRRAQLDPARATATGASGPSSSSLSSPQSPARSASSRDVTSSFRFTAVVTGDASFE